MFKSELHSYSNIFNNMKHIMEYTSSDILNQTGAAWAHRARTISKVWHCSTELTHSGKYGVAAQT